MKDIIDMSRQRGYFIDQSQSLNLFLENANFAKLTSMHFYAWKSGLKTGMYYLRTKSAVDAIKFTLDNSKKKEPVAVEATEAVGVTPIAEVQAKGATAIDVQTTPVEEDVAPMSEAEMKALIAQAKAASGNPDDDCLMCGS